MAEPFYQAFVEIVPEAKNLRRTLAKEFDAAGDDGGKRAGTGVSRGILGSVGSLAAPLAVAIGSLGIGKAFADSISNASDFAESATAITAVFGESDKTIQNFAAGAAAGLGQSKNQALDAARTFGVFGKAAGLSGEDLASFSTEFVTLAGDLASFNNTTPEQAIQALGAGLRGESEPLRQYGVLLDDAALKARATELGIYSGTGALTQQQKVLAAQAEIMAQTSTQQGDFARTSGGLANQQRILAAGMENLSTQFGAVFLPVATTVVKFLNTAVVPALAGIGPAIDLVVGAFTGAGADVDLGGWTNPLIELGASLRSAWDIAAPFFQAIGPLFASLGAAFAPLIPQLLTLWTSFSPLSLIFQSLAPLLPQIVGIFTELATVIGGTLGGVLTAILPVFTEISGVISGALGQAFAILLPIIVDLASTLGGVFGTVITALLPLIVMLAETFGTIFAALAPVIPPILELVGAILQLISPLLSLIGPILTPLIGLFTKLLEPILALITPLLDILIPIIQFVVEVLGILVEGISEVIGFFQALVTGSNDAGEGVEEAFGSMIDFIVGIPNQILKALGNLGTVLFSAGKDLINGLLNGAGSILKTIGKFFLDVLPSWIVGPFKAAFGINSPSKVMAEQGSYLMAGLQMGIDGGRSSLERSMSSLDLTPPAMRLDSASINATTGISGGTPSELVIVDADRQLIGRMRVEAGGVVSGYDNQSSQARTRGSRGY